MTTEQPAKPVRKTWKQLQVENAGGLLPAKDVLSAVGCSFKSATLFDLMRAFGYITDGTRKSSASDAVRTFAILSEAGGKYGENLPGYKSNETDMFFHKDKLPELLNDLGQALIAQSKALQTQG